MNSRILHFFWVLIAFSGCSDVQTGLPPRFATGLTLVAVSDTGEFIDAISVSPDDSITLVVFHVPDNVKEMQVALWGDRIDIEGLPKDCYGSARNLKSGGFGEVRIQVLDGTAVGVAGNGVGSPFVLPPKLVEQVQQYLDSGKSPRISTEIRR